MQYTKPAAILRLSSQQQWFQVRLQVATTLPSVLWAAGRASGLQKTEWWGALVVVCLEQGADLHKVKLIPLPPTVSCFSKIQIGFTFLVLAHLGSPGKRAVKRVCVCYR